MIYPPKPMDPKKDFFTELTRYACEKFKYEQAIEDGINDHGPWYQASERKNYEKRFGGTITSKPLSYFDDPTEMYYWDRSYRDE